VMLKGAGETSDAHHISAPHPDGDGAAAAMQQALQQAGMTAAGVSYINLHGTATEQNDRMESRAVSRVFGHAVPVSSTKALTGHTLGAAGAVEAAFCWLALQGDGQLPPHIWDNQPDPELPELNYVSAPLAAAPDCVLSNSFAFGGNNISLLFGRT
jgi:3-oxoacyl-[acyl-carrier-protein] synthase-1